MLTSQDFFVRIATLSGWSRSHHTLEKTMEKEEVPLVVPNKHSRWANVLWVIGILLIVISIVMGVIRLNSLNTHSILWTVNTATYFIIAAVELATAFLYWKAKENRKKVISWVVLALSFFALGVLNTLPIIL